MNTQKSQFQKSTGVPKNGISELAQLCSSLSQRELLTKTNKHIKEHELTCQRDNFVSDRHPITNKIHKPILSDEINNLAEKWCQLLMNQVQEEQSKRTIPECH
jgi:hypothetical protein